MEQIAATVDFAMSLGMGTQLQDAVLATLILPQNIKGDSDYAILLLRNATAAAKQGQSCQRLYGLIQSIATPRSSTGRWCECQSAAKH